MCHSGNNTHKQKQARHALPIATAVNCTHNADRNRFWWPCRHHPLTMPRESSTSSMRRVQSHVTRTIDHEMILDI
jgi:hypothetical protein